MDMANHRRPPWSPPERPGTKQAPSGVGSSPGSGSVRSTPPMTARASPKSTWAWPGGCVSGTNISRRRCRTPRDVVLHNGDLARKAVLITQPLEYPLRCVTLLLRTILILFQDTVDNTDERIELRADRRPRPDITRWHRIAQHLPDRARVDPKTTSRFALAQTLNHYRVANPPIQFHSLHPPPFAPKCKGLSLTEFCSGATRLSGRFSEGLLLRRSHPMMSIITEHRMCWLSADVPCKLNRPGFTGE